MDNQGIQTAVDDQTIKASTQRPTYETPRVTVMDDADVLKTFQFTSAMISWWVM